MYHVVSDLETMYPSLDMVERPKYKLRLPQIL